MSPHPDCGLPSFQSDTITTSVLNLALLLMQAWDYEAAYNVFLRYDNCQVPANSIAVGIVLCPLLARIWRERRKAAKNDAWLRTFLGPGWYENTETDGSFSLQGTNILERLWGIGSAVPQVDCWPKDSGADWRTNAGADARRVVTGKIERLSPGDL